jgi:hypothetical protein
MPCTKSSRPGVIAAAREKLREFIAATFSIEDLLFVGGTNM